MNECLLLDLRFDGNVSDISGYGRHGKLNGPKLAPDRFGRANRAYMFDGVDDFIGVDTAGLRNNTYSFSIWAKLNSIPLRGEDI